MAMWWTTAAGSGSVLAPGSLLVAAPGLLDPNFRRTVVYVIEHRDGGSLGVVLNRPSEVSVRDVLPSWAPLSSQPPAVFVGGPVEGETALCLAAVRTGHDPTKVDGLVRVRGPVALVDLDSDPSAISELLRGLRVFAGYSGWDPGPAGRRDGARRLDRRARPARRRADPQGRRALGARAAPAGHAAGAAGHLPGGRPAELSRSARIQAPAAGPRMGGWPDDLDPIRTRPGQESVWQYPRPPRAELDARRAVLRHAGVVVADTTDLVRVLETSHPPTFYLPRTAFGEHLRPVERLTFCEWKGAARYVDVVVPGAPRLREVGWWYPDPDRRVPGAGRPGGRLRRDRSTR